MYNTEGRSPMPLNPPEDFFEGVFGICLAQRGKGNEEGFNEPKKKKN
jgi:hypothetical protein